jgi:uncharacterized protein (TIGR03437 family)
MRSPFPNSLRFTALLPVVLLSLLGLIDTANAQQDSLLVSPSSYTFSSPFGGGAQPALTIQVTSSAAPLSYTLTYQSALNWFVATTMQSATPGQVVVNANAGQLPPGTYSGTITLTPSGASTTPVTIPLSLVIAPSNAVSVSPTALTFVASAGSTTPTASQTLTVTSATNNLPYSTSVTYGQANVTNWLQGIPPSGVTNSSINVIANPSGLAAGTYTASITFTTSQGSPQVVNVTFTVNALPTLTSNVSTIPFYYQIGQSQTFASSTVLTISSGPNSSVPINLSTTTSSCPGFLGVSQAGPLTTPATVTVFAAGLSGYTSPTTCSGTVVVTSAATSNPTLNIPVTLTVSNNPLVAITPTTASFTYQVGGTAPANQNLTIASSTAGLTFAASSNQPWLAVTPSGVTSSSSQIALSLVPSQLTSLIPGSYQATVTVNAGGAANTPITIPVTLTVSANSMLTFSPPFANFVYEIGQVTPNTQTISIGTTGGQIPFAISLATTATPFVTVTPTSGIAPTTITLAASPGSLTAGTYTNTINVTPTSAGQSQTPQTIPVQLTISSAGVAQLNASPQAITFTYSPGGSVSPTTQPIALTSTDPVNAMTISNVTTNSSWVNTNFVPGSMAMTPQNLLVTVNPAFLTPSATPYTSNLTISAVNPQGQTSTATIQVTLNYTTGVSLTATPASLTFTQVANAAAPAPQSVNIGASGTTGANLPFSATVSTLNGVNWLSVSPAAGTAPGTVSVGITATAATLPAGTYSGSVVIFGMGAANPNGTLTIPVTLTVNAAPTLTANPVGLTFTGSAAGVNPAPQTLQVTAPNSTTSVAFTAAAATASGGNWLALSSTSGSTPATLTVNANLTGLAQGTYNGTISLTPTGGAATIVNVSLTVSAQATPSLTQIINAASGATGAVAPGEIISIFGTNLGPATPAYLTLNPAGNVTTTLAGVTVTFNGIPAPLTYVSASQINCVVPFEVSSVASAQVQISFNGVTSAATAAGITATQPGVFTQNSSGTGLGSILLPNYSTVSASNPATRGTPVIIYATGGGLTTPSSVTGGVAGSTLLLTNAKVAVTIGGVAATVTYAGSAPGLVQGVLQVNAIVPATISAGSQPIVVTVGSNSSQNLVTVAVQ